MLQRPFRAGLAALAFAAAMSVVAADAAPRFNAGSRGSRTFSAPPPTATAPSAARPIERSVTQPGAVTRPATPAAAAKPGFFNRPGLLGGLAAGFLGAGLIGLLLGHGFLGGLAGFASFLGLLLQVGLLVVVAMLIWRWFQRRSEPALAGGPSLRDAGFSAEPRAPFGGRSFGGSAGPAIAPLDIKPADFDTFERLLGEIHTAYGREDIAALRARVTPEMLSYYSEELAQNQARGVVNRITDVKLLQGDLSEAWREGGDEYATVAMRYSLDDRYVDRATGKLIEQGPAEAVELWTFRRGSGGSWVLSAIQQTE